MLLLWSRARMRDGAGWTAACCTPRLSNNAQKKTPAIPRNRRGQVFRAGCVRGGVQLPDRGQGILVGAAAGAGAAAAVTIGAVGRRAG